MHHIVLIRHLLRSQHFLDACILRSAQRVHSRAMRHLCLSFNLHLHLHPPSALLSRHESPRRRSGSSPGNGLCRRTKLYVEFRDMGWGEWIVAPTGYWAHQCEGSCAFPMSANMNVTNHAAVKSLMHSMTTAGVRAPCCVPVKLAPQNLLYIDSYDHVVLKTFPEMTVADCGCR